MKLAIVCTEKLPAPSIRGGAIQMMLDGITPYLSEMYDVTVFSIEDPLLEQDTWEHNVHYIHLPQENYTTHVAAALTADFFDIVHVCNRPKSILTYKAASPRSKFVLSLHNDMFTEKKVAFEDGEKIVAQVDAMTAVSDYVKQTVIDRFPAARRKFTTVYSGVNLDSFPLVTTKQGQAIRNKYRKKYRLGNKKVILFVGRLSKNKGPHLLIKAMKQILRKEPNAVLVIAGGKWFSDNRVNKYVQYLYDKAAPFKQHILFTQFIPADEIPNIFLMADVFVCSSQWNEPLARVHYEAMAAGVPIVTTDRGGNAEVISHEHNGLLVTDYQRTQAFAENIIRALSDQTLRDSMTKNGRDMVEANFTYAHVANRYARVYNSTIRQQFFSLRALLR